jgi:amino-acid N-acetyltransferase
MKIRKAKMTDIKSIHRLVNAYADKNQMIPRSLNDLYENMRDLLVCEDEGQIKGVCALHVLWDNLAEIRSLAVQENSRDKGIGKLLVRRALRDAKALGIGKVFALTYYPDYFIKSFGFVEIDKTALPHKIWGDCLRCHKFPECDEVAVMKEFK